MKSIAPIALAGCLAAVLISVTQAEAPLAEMPGRLTKSVDHQGHVPRTIAESGKFHCSLTTLNYLGVATVTADTLNERVAVEFSNWRSENSEIRIHRRLLYPIFLQNNGSVARDTEGKESYLPFSGSKITAQNDSIVANFENNALAKVEQRNSALQSQVPHFTGFKAYLGRHTEREENGWDTEVEVYFRIIVDWRYQSQRQDEMSVHRAAIVISQVPIGVAAGREKFYRFRPSLSPFRMLACVLDDAKVI